MEQERSDNQYIAGDLVQSTVVGLKDFEYNSFGTLGILIEVIGTREAAKVWWFGSEKPSTVLFRNFKLLSRTSKAS
tara:strand:- start:4005 stop:4232 length:228 start_codon:yes stop_codon:yes gene_type:complete